MALPRAEIVAEFKKPCLIGVTIRHKPFVFGTFNLSPEAYHMKGSIFLVCLILLFFLVVAGIPVAASPSVTDIRPVSAPNNGDVTVTITGTGFNSQSTVWMTPSSVCDPSHKIYGTVCSWSSTSGTCTFSFRDQNPGLYTVWVNSPTSPAIFLIWLPFPQRSSDLPGFRRQHTQSRPFPLPQRHPTDPRTLWYDLR